MSSKTALVVDDSRSARFALRRYLEHHAYTVETAESAEEAYNFLQTHQPEVIFLDHVMPGTDGFTALRYLKENPQTGSIPVVICSSNEGDTFSAEARSRGAIDVLQKPPSPEQLTRVLENLQVLSAELRQQQAETTASAAPAASKVTSLREPDVTLGQAVLNVLRHTLSRNDATHEPAAAPAASAVPPPPAVVVHTPPPAPPAAEMPPALAAVESVPAPLPVAAAPMPAPVSAPAAAALPAGRDPLEARLKKLTQDLYGQLGELKAGFALLESRLPEPEEEPQPLIDTAAREQLQDLQQRLGWLESRVEARLHELQQQFELQLVAHTARAEQLADLQQALEQRLEQQLQLQNRRLDEVAQQARAAAAEEAHAASERTVMSAAARIADQLADSIARALGRK